MSVIHRRQIEAEATVRSPKRLVSDSWWRKKMMKAC